MKKMLGMLVSAALAACVAQAADTLPRVLIIGDSISIGYTPFVKELMTNKAVIVHAPGNNAATVTGLKRLDAWIGDKKWDVIHFNWGLHDMKYVDPATAETDMAKLISVKTGTQWVPVESYETNLKVLVQRLKQTGAKLVWCSTTPVPEGANGRVPGDEAKYNAAALRVMQAEGVQVNDLCAVVGTPQHRAEIGGKKADVHYTNAGSKVLAAEMVKAIEKALAK
jgi:acyl-CoA thioesterase-1